LFTEEQIEQISKIYPNAKLEIPSGHILEIEKDIEIWIHNNNYYYERFQNNEQITLKMKTFGRLIIIMKTLSSLDG